jgi:hypothetical protein
VVAGLAGLLHPFLRPYIAGRIVLVTARLVIQAVGNLFLPIFTRTRIPSEARSMTRRTSAPGQHGEGRS